MRFGVIAATKPRNNAPLHIRKWANDVTAIQKLARAFNVPIEDLVEVLEDEALGALRQVLQTYRISHSPTGDSFSTL